jgi:hypothetical protein
MENQKTPGMTFCKVCGRPFALNAEDHYISADIETTGITSIISKTEPETYDSFDCPHCGCQNVMQIRKKEVCPCEYGICDECNCCEEDSKSEDASEEAGPGNGKERV